LQDGRVADVQTLNGTRVMLRAPRLDDAEEMFAALTSDPEVTRYLTWTPHPDVQETRRVITELFNVGDEPTWAIELRDTGQVVGTGGWQRPRPHTVEFGYCLGRRWWRHGIMSRWPR
jgi:RimJ/RimL family protein N-acetyltransferase